MSQAIPRLASILMVLACAAEGAPPASFTPVPVTGGLSPSILPVKPVPPPCGVESPALNPPWPGSTNSEPNAPGVRKRSTGLDVTTRSGGLGMTVPLRARLSLPPEGAGVANHTVHFWIDDRYVGRAKTGTNGVAEIQYKLETVGISNVRGRYLGSDVCGGSQGQSTIATTKAGTTVSLFNSAGLVVQDRLQLMGELTRNTDGKRIAGREIIVSRDGQQVARVATGDGARFDWPFVRSSEGPGSHTLTAAFAGDDLYTTSSASLTFTIVPPPSAAALNWTALVEGRVGETKTVVAKLKKIDSSNLLGAWVDALDPAGLNGISGVSIRVWRERGFEFPPPRVERKDLGTAVTNSEGLATITFKIEDAALAYYVTAYAEGAQTAWAVATPPPTAIHRLIVSRSPVNLTVTGPASARIGDTVSLGVLATRATDGAPIPSLGVSGHVHGTTNAAGRITGSYKVGGTQLGPVALTSTSFETDRYAAGTGTITINVLPATN